MWTSHVTHVNESCRTYKSVMSHVHRPRSLLYLPTVVTSHIGMSHVIHVNESHHTDNSVTRTPTSIAVFSYEFLKPIWMSHGRSIPHDSGSFPMNLSTTHDPWPMTHNALFSWPMTHNALWRRTAALLQKSLTKETISCKRDLYFWGAQRLINIRFHNETTRCESWCIQDKPCPLQRTATHCNTRQQTATNCNTRQHTVPIMMIDSLPRCKHVMTSPLQQTATDCNTWQQTATDCNRLQQTATDCNRLQ